MNATLPGNDSEPTLPDCRAGLASGMSPVQACNRLASHTIDKSVGRLRRNSSSSRLRSGALAGANAIPAATHAASTVRPRALVNSTFWPGLLEMSFIPEQIAQPPSVEGFFPINVGQHEWIIPFYRYRQSAHGGGALYLHLRQRRRLLRNATGAIDSGVSLRKSGFKRSVLLRLQP